MSFVGVPYFELPTELQIFFLRVGGEYYPFIFHNSEIVLPFEMYQRGSDNYGSRKYTNLVNFIINKYTTESGTPSSIYDLNPLIGISKNDFIEFINVKKIVDPTNNSIITNMMKTSPITQFPGNSEIIYFIIENKQTYDISVLLFQEEINIIRESIVEYPLSHPEGVKKQVLNRVGVRIHPLTDTPNPLNMYKIRDYGTLNFRIFTLNPISDKTYTLIKQINQEYKNKEIDQNFIDGLIGKKVNVSMSNDPNVDKMILMELDPSSLSSLARVNVHVENIANSRDFMTEYLAKYYPWNRDHNLVAINHPEQQSYIEYLRMLLTEYV